MINQRWPASYPASKSIPFGSHQSKWITYSVLLYSFYCTLWIRIIYQLVYKYVRSEAQREDPLSSKSNLASPHKRQSLIITPSLRWSSRRNMTSQHEVPSDICPSDPVFRSQRWRPIKDQREREREKQKISIRIEPKLTVIQRTVEPRHHSHPRCPSLGIRIHRNRNCCRNRGDSMILDYWYWGRRWDYRWESKSQTLLLLQWNSKFESAIGSGVDVEVQVGLMNVNDCLSLLLKRGVKIG